MIGTVLTDNIFLGALIGIFASLLLSGIFASISLGLNANVFFAGLATNLFATGFSIFIQSAMFHQKGAISLPSHLQIPTIQIPFIKSIPGIGVLLSGYTIFIYLSWIIVILSYILIYKTSFGLRMRAVGEAPDAFVSIGLNSKKYQFISIVMSGLTCGIAGAGLSLTIKTYAPNMINNRGWIGLVTIFLGGQNPAGITAAAFLFGGAEQASYLLQISSITIPHHFIQVLPFVITILAMVAHAELKKIRHRVVKISPKRNFG